MGGKDRNLLDTGITELGHWGGETLLGSGRLLSVMWPHSSPHTLMPPSPVWTSFLRPVLLVCMRLGLAGMGGPAHTCMTVQLQCHLQVALHQVVETSQAETLAQLISQAWPQKLWVSEMPALRPDVYPRPLMCGLSVWWSHGFGLLGWSGGKVSFSKKGIGGPATHGSSSWGSVWTDTTVVPKVSCWGPSQLIWKSLCLILHSCLSGVESQDMWLWGNTILHGYGYSLLPAFGVGLRLMAVSSSQLLSQWLFILS